MGIKLIEGFDHGSGIVANSIGVIVGSNSTFSNGIDGNGGYSLRLWSNTYVSYEIQDIYDFKIGFHLHIGSWTTVQNPQRVLEIIGENKRVLYSLEFDSLNSLLYIVNEYGIKYYGNQQTNLNANYHVELGIKMDPLEGVIELKRNGTRELIVQDINTISTAEVVDSIRFGRQYGRYVYIDNVYVVDSSDGTDYLGELLVKPYSPIANIQNDFEPVPGTSENYSLVNEVIQDEDSTYNRSSTPGAMDKFELANIPPTSSAIAAVSLTTVAKTRSGFGIRHFLNVDNTNYFGETLSGATSYAAITDQFLINPSTLLPWTKNDIQHLVSGYELVSL